MQYCATRGYIFFSFEHSRNKIRSSIEINQIASIYTPSNHADISKVNRLKCLNAFSHFTFLCKYGNCVKSENENNNNQSYSIWWFCIRRWACVLVSKVIRKYSYTAAYTILNCVVICVAFASVLWYIYLCVVFCGFIVVVVYYYCCCCWLQCCFVMFMLFPFYNYYSCTWFVFLRSLRQIRNCQEVSILVK